MSSTPWHRPALTSCWGRKAGTLLWACSPSARTPAPPFLGSRPRGGGWFGLCFDGRFNLRPCLVCSGGDPPRLPCSVHHNRFAAEDVLLFSKFYAFLIYGQEEEQLKPLTDWFFWCWPFKSQSGSTRCISVHSNPPKKIRIVFVAYSNQEITYVCLCRMIHFSMSKKQTKKKL